MKLLQLPNKRIRASVIKKHYGDSPLFCFSCGNASAALIETGADIITPTPDRYISPKEAAKLYGDNNVTSGCLPISIVKEISFRYRSYITDKGDTFYVPCGSGETLFALSFFIPITRLVAVVADYPPVKLDYMTPLYTWINENVRIIDLGGINSLSEIPLLLGGLDGILIDTRGQGLIYND